MAILSRVLAGAIGYIIRFGRGLGNVEKALCDGYCRAAMDRFVKPFLLATVLMLAAAAQAAAQIQPDVTANPNATGTRVLLYPGGQYGRVMRPLLEPGERDPNAPIVLHMPRKHPKRTVQAKPKPDVAMASAAPPPAKVPKPPKTQKPAPSEDTVSVSGLPDESAAKLVMAEPSVPAKPRPAPPKQVAVAKPPPAPPKPQPVATKAPPKQAAPKQVAAAKPPQKGLPPAPTETEAFVVSGDQSGGSAAIPPSAPPPSAPAQAPPTRTASAEPPATNTATTELSKRSSILFTPGAEEPPAGALDTIKGMTASLTAALWSGTAHIQLEAFGGKSGDKSSDARRLSLKRALIIRQLLIDDGIPSERIVVRAMGGAGSGALDRVDIFVAA
jgi:outer membrane protein OmpA-like peptidoglycan-associated protein